VTSAKGPDDRVEHPLVSIVMPVFNQAQYVVEAIESVLAQDYPRIELIVLDDGSTDATPEILRNFGDRCHTESHANIGQAATLNKGWGMACGEILSYLSADDRLDARAVSLSIAALAARPEAVMAYGDFELIDPSSRFIRSVQTMEYDYRKMAVDLFCLPGPGVFFRRSAWAAAGPWDGTLRQIPDFEYWLRLGLQGPFVRVPQVLASYRVHDESQSFLRVSEARAEEPLAVMQRFYERAQLPPELASSRDRAISNSHILSARLHLRAGRWRMGLGHLQGALRLWPGNALRLRTHRLLLNAVVNRVGHKVFWEINRLRRGPIRRI
jgi:glycosyltransferase involved in cell wall biosynthesis